MSRHDGRKADQMRPVQIRRGVSTFAAGSALIQMGRTQVLCTASIEKGVPRWREESGLGWLTAEYDMLPASTPSRRQRNRTRIDGRTQEIQRLIGRVIRAVTDFASLGQNTIYLDCDVLQADGGTRTAAITGAYVAMLDAQRTGWDAGLWTSEITREPVAAISAGIVNGQAVLDLDYQEDSQAEVDFNIAMTATGRFVEVQGTAEHAPFDRKQLDALLKLAAGGIRQLIDMQQAMVRRKSVRRK